MPSLVVRQSQASSPKLLLQDAVFLPQVVDDSELMAIHPTGQPDEHAPKFSGPGRTRAVSHLSWP